MDESATAGGQGVATLRGGGLLTDPHRLESDLNLLRRAVREEWPVSEADRPAIVSRLREIVAKTTCSVPTKAGPMELDGPADKNSIAAAAVLERMVGANQSERHFVGKLAAGANQQKAPAITVNGPAQIAIVVKDEATRKAIEEAI